MDARPEDDKQRVSASISIEFFSPFHILFVVEGLVDARLAPNRHQLLQIPRAGRPTSRLL